MLNISLFNNKKQLFFNFYYDFRRIGEIMNDVVDKHAVTWVASAGNHGPALCTIGAPPDISNTTIIGNKFKCHVHPYCNILVLT